MAVERSSVTPQTTDASAKLVLKLPPFRALSGKDAKEIILLLRSQKNPCHEQECPSTGDLHLSAHEFLSLMRMDQLYATLATLERMEKHYREVAKLNAEEVRRRLDAAHPDDPGVLALKHCLVEGADPRVPIALRLLTLIPIAIRRVEEGKQALELVEIFALDQRANQLIEGPHLRRGLYVLIAGREGGRRRNPEGKSARAEVAREFCEAKVADPHITQQQFLHDRGLTLSRKTLQRALRDLKH